MAYEMPVVLYDLPQGHECAGSAAFYAIGNNPIDFADKMAQLLDSDPMRKQMGAIGRRRVVESLNWGNEKPELLRAYKTALDGDSSR
jgi:glycosyltransferase involved in cell wall biosynthesis